MLPVLSSQVTTYHEQGQQGSTAARHITARSCTGHVGAVGNKMLSPGYVYISPELCSHRVAWRATPRCPCLDPPRKRPRPHRSCCPPLGAEASHALEQHLTLRRQVRPTGQTPLLAKLAPASHLSQTSPPPGCPRSPGDSLTSPSSTHL